MVAGRSVALLLASVMSPSWSDAADVAAGAWTVSVAPNATSAEQFAAATLVRELSCTAPGCGEAENVPGLAPKYVTGRAGGGGTVAVGLGAATSAGASGSSLERIVHELGDDGYLLSTNSSLGIPPNCVVVVAAEDSARGAVHGAFALLKHLGFRFIAWDETVVPARPSAPVPDR